jgi:deoxycytidylate deaminase
LKRKVGAGIASPTGDIVAAGHNEVPQGAVSCIHDPRYGWCARDVLQERLGRDIKHCPSCGEPVAVEVSCGQCGAKVTEYGKRCPTCRAALEVDYTCPGCERKIFRDFLPGAGSERTGKLLDLCRALHAEENAILNLAKFGVRLPTCGAEKAGIPHGCVLYSTTFPCNLCANKIVAVGIRKVVYAEPYTMDEAKKVFEQEGVTTQRFQGVKSRAFFRLYA